jgi:hypothetical protein
MELELERVKGSILEDQVRKYGSPRSKHIGSTINRRVVDTCDFVSQAECATYSGAIL